MEEFASFTYSDRNYFESLSRFPITPVYSDLLQSLLPADWKVTRFDVFLQAHSERTVLKPQGFKIHISSPAAEARTVLQRVVPECVRAEVMFKVVADPRLLRFQNSKRYSRGGSGKFVTIYPPDEACFLRLIEGLHQATRDLEGPYILSDKQYRDSKVVFYRYGGFQRMYQLLTDGTRQTLIRKPDGTGVPDVRTPYFQLPEWVKDPIPDEPEPEQDSTGLLGGRFKVVEALSFTNTGGVYRAIDQQTGLTVCIKEARPHTETWLGGERTVDAITALQREHDNLQRLQGLPCVPRLIELFQAWEHRFLAVSFVEGEPLATVRVSEDFIVMTHVDEPERVVRFCTTWKDLALRLLDAVESIHSRGMVVGDISPGNVLLNRDTGELTLIDFEGALVRGEASAFSAQWFNPGFRRPDRRRVDTLEPADDFYACGMLLYNLVCPIQNQFELDPAHPTFRILDHFVEAGLPSQVRSIIQALLEGRVDAARHEAKSWTPSTRRVLLSEASSPAVSDANLLSDTVRGLARHMLAVMDPSRTDRLFPPDPMAFQTNALNVAHGACGTALFLHDALGELPQAVREWLLVQPVDVTSYAPGLYSGIAGVAWSFMELGLQERALELLALIPNSPLAFQAVDMFDGAAGWGLASLAFHQRTRDEKFLGLACRAGEHLLATAERSEAGVCWRREDGSVPLGFARGGSGMAFFLLSLWRVTNEARYLEAARRAMDFEVAQAQERDGGLVWGVTAGEPGHRPYWLRGGAGVASALIRFFEVLKEERYLSLAHRAARGCAVFFSAAPHLFEGLASMGETLLDMYRVTGEPRYLEQARRKATQALLFRIDKPQGVAFPGRYLQRISHDYGLGGAGIGLFLHRVATRGPRRFHDILEPR
ncbi:class III lanthionine synthetase LanKC [Pyxidicoccus parkwayensis]|uniref:Class III lanthionine synthetase LanKC n=1 Tax=Pyxidicoccus parkwayensis TaxID=2813578 RepID=A0ABX7P9B6_9BACT|nr:class III lanthionine synthetase LanKC [Pyxidicoccus parkwaysis]QSQ27056.1 class III lanthionine synthetase LanKC [Pyxidicoccus parkwaysis]